MSDRAGHNPQLGILNRLRQIYGNAPAPVRAMVAPIVRWRRYVRRMRVELLRIDGIEKSTGMPLAIVCGTEGQNKNLLLGLIFRDSTVSERPLGRTWLWNVDKAIRRAGDDCALAVIGLRHSHRGRLRSGHWLFIPCWVNGVVDIPLGPNVVSKENVRSDLRKIRNHALSYEVSKDPTSFDEFYYHMYLPHITRAHGDGGYIVPYDEKRTLFQMCELLFVKMGDLRVAGVLLLHETDGPRIWSLGVKDSNDDYVKSGAVAAVFHFSFEYLASKGHSRVRIGASRPFLRDGALQFKRKLSQTIASASPDGFALRILSWTPALQGFLMANPFIYQGDAGLWGAVFVDPDGPLGEKELAALEKSHLHSGMAGLTAYRLPGQGHQTEPIRPISEKLRIRPAQELGGR